MATMTVTTILDMADECDHNPPDNGSTTRYGARVIRAAVREGRDALIATLQDIHKNGADADLDIRSTDWIDHDTNPGDWALTLDSNMLMLEWVVGPTTNAYIDAEHIIGPAGVDQIIAMWNHVN